MKYLRRHGLAVALLCGTFPLAVHGQLDVDFSVDITLGDDGVFTYTYSLFNDDLSSQSINAVLVSTAANAPVIDIISANDNWVASYAPEEEVFQALFATGLSADGVDCGVTDQFDLFPGQTATFTITSPWSPKDQLFTIGRTQGPGIECDFVGDFADGLIASPSVPINECDFDSDGDCDLGDINSLASAIAGGISNAKFDLNLDNTVDTADLVAFLVQVSSLNGDSDFNGKVEFADFLTMSGSFGNEAPWSSGDFDADGTVAFADFLILSGNFGRSSTATFANVPEPSLHAGMVALALLVCSAASRRTRANRFARKRSRRRGLAHAGIVISYLSIGICPSRPKKLCLTGRTRNSANGYFCSMN